MIFAVFKSNRNQVDIEQIYAEIQEEDSNNSNDEELQPPEPKRRETATDDMDEAECKELMRPCKKQLKRLQEGTDHLEREKKVVVLKECLSAVGGHIEHLLESDPKIAHLSPDKKRKWSRHLWCFCSYFWPKEVRPSKLRGIFEKIVGTGTADGSSKRKGSDGHRENGGEPKKAKH